MNSLLTVLDNLLRLLLGPALKFPCGYRLAIFLFITQLRCINVRTKLKYERFIHKGVFNSNMKYLKYTPIENCRFILCV